MLTELITTSWNLGYTVYDSLYNKLVYYMRDWYYTNQQAIVYGLLSDNPTLRAAKNNECDVLESLKKEGTLNLEATDAHLNTPLIAAAIHGKFEAAKWLIDNGADITAKSINGFTILHWAVSFKNLEMIDFLIQDKAISVNQVVTMSYKESDSQTIQFQTTPLMMAARNGSINIIESLIKAGADVNYCDQYDEDHKSAIAVAIRAKQSEAVKCLLSHEATLPQGLPSDLYTWLKSYDIECHGIEIISTIGATE